MPFMAAVMLCLAPSEALWAQQSRTYSRDELIATAREIITNARYSALITRGPNGRAQARAMDPFPPDEKLIVWFGTNSRSRKVAEIRRHPYVTLYYFDRENEAYVTIHGIARLVNDAKAKEKYWKDEWKAFYPDREKGYLLIEVRPQKLEVVHTRKNIVGDVTTWRPPVVNFPNRN
jgi:general stress protein 26